MFIEFFKADPTDYVLHHQNGVVKREGAGIQFWFMPMHASIALVPLATQDLQFIFTERTMDFQEVSVQGSLTYRILEPKVTAATLDFTVDPVTGLYRSEDPKKLGERIVGVVQSKARDYVNRATLTNVLKTVQTLADHIAAETVHMSELAALGVEVEGVHVAAVRATPEMQKALETEYREKLQQEADLAIFARRGAAVEEERKIRESEVATDVELENRRRELTDTQARNKLVIAEADAKAEELRIDPYATMPPQALVALALKEWAAGSGNIQNLTISPDMLDKLVGWVTTPSNVQEPQAHGAHDG